MSKEKLKKLVDGFSLENLQEFLWDANFKEEKGNLSSLNDENIFSEVQKLGAINTDDKKKVIVSAIKVTNGLSERACRKKQYELGKKILKAQAEYEAGIFVFYDKDGAFRFSLIYYSYSGTRRMLNSFKRFTYFVSPDLPNKTFLKQLGEKKLATLDEIKAAFSIAAVTDIFYKDFFVEYQKVIDSVGKANKIKDQDAARDFVLLFAIRTIFLGFIQKKKWIGGDENFIQNFFKEYTTNSQNKDKFFSRWLSPLFFEALNTAPGHKVAYRDNEFSEATEKILQMAPYLNGGLFKEKSGVDNKGWYIPDSDIKNFFDFLFSHSFTIEENSPEDEDLQLNPEFLGIIFERLLSGADGAVYTPRTEVDLMCRLSLAKWLQKNLENPIKAKELYELFFREEGKDEDQKNGSFSLREAQEILNKLENLAICDPAVGSGAFLVGMMQVLDDVEQTLRKDYKLNDKNVFDRKKEIIKNSLYGVEVKEWAVWICQLRLWLSLFVDAPDNLNTSLEPILPSLDFKVRRGDSLVQRIGSKAFPISGHNISLNKSIKDKITKLKNFKIDYFDNKTESIYKDYDITRQKEIAIYKEILDFEIKEKKDEITRLKNIKPAKTGSLFGVEEQSEQLDLGFNEREVERFELEISELREQKQNLFKEKPLMWSIEFAEIFADKGGFDIIIGNPPYVRQEAIGDPTGKIKDKKEYKNYLAEMVRIDFPDDFPPKTKINAQSDLYTYFYIRGLRLLNPQGIHTFICSNSWLDVGYGTWLQKFLLERAAVDLIIDNHARRSFEAADVNTIISIIHAPIAGRKKQVENEHIVKFVAFKKPFEESVYTENLLQIEEAKEIVSNEIFRVYPLQNNELKEAGTEYESKEQKTLGGKYVGDKWGGKYLRAPDIFFKILEKGKDELVKLGDIADVRRGITTGVNDFFYFTDTKAKEWGIEEEFLKPVIKSPRECKSILVDPKNLKYNIFICNKSKEELKGTNALKYIEWGEKQKTKQLEPKDEVLWKEVPSVQGRKYWYGLGERKSSKINFNYLIDQIGISYVGDIFVSDNFHEIRTDKELSAYLNSVVFYLFQLNTGRIGFGGGLLKIQTYELNFLPAMETTAADLKYLQREIKSIFEECGIDPKSDIPIEEQEPKPLPDRAELDKIVFDALDLTESERKEVYRAVCRLVWNRISKAKSV